MCLVISMFTSALIRCLVASPHTPFKLDISLHCLQTRAVIKIIKKVKKEPKQPLLGFSV